MTDIELKKKKTSYGQNLKKKKKKEGKPIGRELD